MTSAVDLADEFIEALVKGDIESYYPEALKNGNLNANFFGDRLEELQKSIRIYRAEQDVESKKGLAEDVLDGVVGCRLYALVKNNPNNLRQMAEQRDFHKEKVEQLEADLRGKDRIIGQLSDDITKLKVGMGAVR